MVMVLMRLRLKMGSLFIRVLRYLVWTMRSMLLLMCLALYLKMLNVLKIRLVRKMRLVMNDLKKLRKLLVKLWCSRLLVLVTCLIRMMRITWVVLLVVRRPLELVYDRLDRCWHRLALLIKRRGLVIFLLALGPLKKRNGRILRCM